MVEGKGYFHRWNHGGVDLGTRLLKVNITKTRKDETLSPSKPGLGAPNFYLQEQCWETLAKNMKAEAMELKSYLPSHDFKISPREAEDPGDGTFIPKTALQRSNWQALRPWKTNSNQKNYIPKSRSDTCQPECGFPIRLPKEPQSFQVMIQPAGRRS